MWEPKSETHRNDKQCGPWLPLGIQVEIPQTLKHTSIRWHNHPCQSQSMYGYEISLGPLWWTSFRWGLMSTNHFSGGSPIKVHTHMRVLRAGTLLLAEIPPVTGPKVATAKIASTAEAEAALGQHRTVCCALQPRPRRHRSALFGGCFSKVTESWSWVPAGFPRKYKHQRNSRVRNTDSTCRRDLGQLHMSTPDE